MQKIKFDFEATKQLIYAPNSTAPIGAPVDADGNVANDGTAIGIVLCRRNESDKYWVKQNLVVMVAGYCDIIDAQEIWGDEYSAEAIAAMSDIIFCDDHKIGGGGGWPADLPKPSVGGYGYTDENDTVHKIYERYLPEGGGGAMVVEVDYDGEQFVSTKTVDEVKNAMLTMPVIGIAKIMGEFYGAGIFSWLTAGEDSGFDDNTPMVTMPFYKIVEDVAQFEITPLIAVADGEFVLNI